MKTLTTISLIASSISASAIDYFWDGSQSTHWGRAKNWNSGGNGGSPNATSANAWLLHKNHDLGGNQGVGAGKMIVTINDNDTTDTQFVVRDLFIATNSSDQNWQLNNGSSTGKITVYNRLLFQLESGGSATLNMDLALGDDSVSLKGKGNRAVLNGQLSGAATSVLDASTSYSNGATSLAGGGMTLTAATNDNFLGTIYTGLQKVETTTVNGLRNATIRIHTVPNSFIWPNNATIGALTGDYPLAINNNLKVGYKNSNFTYNGKLSGASHLYKIGSGIWSLGGTISGTHTGTTYINAGQIKLNNSIALADSLVWLNVHNGLNINGNNSTIGGLGGAGNLNIGTNSITIGGAHNTEHLGVISGSGIVIIDTSGSQSLGANNTYSGGTILSGGTLRCQSEGELGNTSGGLTFGNATYRADASHSQNRPLTFAFDSTTSTFEVDSNKTLTWSGQINDNSPDQTLNKTGNGTLAITNDSNVFFGTVNVDSGVIAPSSSGLASARIVLNADNAIDLTGASKTLGSINGSGDFFLSTNITIGNHVPAANYSGHISRSGINTLTKQSSGTQTFSGTSDRIGPTVIENGTIVLNNPSTTPLGTGRITVKNGALLTGSGVGACPVTVDNGGTVSTSNNTASLSLASLVLNGNFHCPIANGGASKFDVSFSANISNGTLNLDLINGNLTQNAYVIMSYGSLTGTFANVQNLPADYDIDYAYNDGNSSNNIAIVKDTTNPQVTISASETSPTLANSIVYSLTFSEPVTGLNNANDFYFTGATNTGGVNQSAIASSVVNSGDNIHFTITLSNITGDGPLQFRLRRGNITDGAGNPLVINASTHADPYSPNITIDNTAPVITLAGASPMNVHHQSSWSDPGATTDDNSTVVVAGDTVNTSIPGSYTLTYNATDAAGNTATEVTRTVIVLTAYKSWSENMGLTEGVNDGFSQDPDKDGRNNLHEFALDGNPLSAVNDGKIGYRVITHNNQRYLELTLPVRNGVTFSGNPTQSGSVDQIQYSIRGSIDLTSWNQTISQQVTSPLVTPLSSGWGYQTFRLELPLGQNPKGFINIDISHSTP